eukprot:651025-Amphidinium_carterae.1
MNKKVSHGQKNVAEEKLSIENVWVCVCVLHFRLQGGSAGGCDDEDDDEGQESGSDAEEDVINA